MYSRSVRHCEAIMRAIGRISTDITLTLRVSGSAEIADALEDLVERCVDGDRLGDLHDAPVRG